MTAAASDAGDGEGPVTRRLREQRDLDAMRTSVNERGQTVYHGVAPAPVLTPEQKAAQRARLRKLRANPLPRKPDDGRTTVHPAPRRKKWGVRVAECWHRDGPKCRPSVRGCQRQ